MSTSPFSVEDPSPTLQPRVIVTLHDGQKISIVGEDGQSVMQLIRNAGIDELPAYCGGACSCATCHVHVADDWLARLPALGETERALLEKSDNCTVQSRLSCQIPFTNALDGLPVTLVSME